MAALDGPLNICHRAHTPCYQLHITPLGMQLVQERSNSWFLRIGRPGEKRQMACPMLNHPHGDCPAQPPESTDKEIATIGAKDRHRLFLD